MEELVRFFSVNICYFCEYSCFYHLLSCVFDFSFCEEIVVMYLNSVDRWIVVVTIREVISFLWLHKH